MKKCVCCEIGAKRLDPELTVYEDEYILAHTSLHQKPGNHGHTFVFPKKHIQDIYELPEELYVPLMHALRLIARATKKAFSAEGIHIRQNNEPVAGQTVFHIHFHVVPRYGADNFEAEEYEKLSISKLGELAERLRPAIQSEIQSSQ